MTRVLALALLCALAGPAFAEEPVAPVAPVDPLAPIDPLAPLLPLPLTPEEIKAAYSDYDTAMSSGNKTKAADALLPILSDAKYKEIHGDAWVKLGDLLAGFDMGYSALIAYSNGIAADGKAGAPKVKAAMDLAQKYGDEAVLAPVLAANVGLDVDGETRSRMAYLAARHYFYEDQLGTAQGLLAMVKKDSPVFGDSELLRGVLLSQQGRHNDALAPLVTAKAIGQEKGKGPRFAAMQSMNLGRAFYGAENYAKAIESFAEVPRASEYWPEAMFERAWAHFRLTDMDGALAILMVHGSPFFEEWYFPEHDLLRVYALFLLCKFPDAQKEVDRFAERYKPIEAALQGPAAGYTPEKAWEQALLFRGGKKSEVPVMVMRRFASDDRLAGAKAAVDKADEEIKRLQNVASSPFAAEAKARLEERRAALIRVEGSRILAHIKRCQNQLNEMLSNLDVTRLDVMQYETELYERASVAGEVEFGDRIGQLRKLRKKPRTLVWPYEGEVWADELGYYQITARPDCPEKLQSGTGP